MKRFFVACIRVYQIVTGWLKRNHLIKDTCVFYPTCSTYAIAAIEKYGIVSGTIRGVKRIARCHPWQKNHFDPV